MATLHALFLTWPDCSGWVTAPAQRAHLAVAVLTPPDRGARWSPVVFTTSFLNLSLSYASSSTDGSGFGTEDKPLIGDCSADFGTGFSPGFELHVTTARLRSVRWHTAGAASWEVLWMDGQRDLLRIIRRINLTLNAVPCSLSSNVKCNIYLQRSQIIQGSCPIEVITN